jgi:phosphoglycerol transferase
MESYDHVRPYIWSGDIKWSWPSFSRQHRNWQMKMSSLQGADFIRGAIYSGFNAIWVDRSAYADHGKKNISSISTEKVIQHNMGSGNIAVLDLREVAAVIKASMSDTEFKQRASEFFDYVTVEWLHGFYREEVNPDNGQRHRWSMKKSQLEIRNQSRARKLVEFRALINGIPGGALCVQAAGGPGIDIFLEKWTNVLNIQLNIESQASIMVTFNYNGQRVTAPGDPREMYFALINPAIVEMPL